MVWWGRAVAPAGFVLPYRREINDSFVVGLVASGLGLAIGGYGIFGGRKRRGSRPLPPSSITLPVEPQATLRAVTVAVDGRKRRVVQAALAQWSAAFDLSTTAGMDQCARAITQRLWDVRESVRYASMHHAIVPASRAQQRFDAMADTLRDRYVVETVRESMRTRGPAVQARAEEGEGFVVVSLVVGLGGEHTPSPHDVLDWKVALQELIPLNAAHWVALRAVWSPTDEDDRMSSAELEVLYPELRRLDDGVGRMVCRHCRAVGAKELGRCPACGAPYPDAATG